MIGTFRLHLLLIILGLALTACNVADTPSAPATQDELGSDLTAPGAPQSERNTNMTVEGENLPGRLLFVQRGTIWLWQGKQGRPLFGEGVAWQPTWSPDGAQIAYIERGESYSDVMLADQNGAHVAQLTYNGSTQPIHSRARVCSSMWAFYPAWLPDSDQLVIASQYRPPSCPPGSPALEYNLALYTLSAPDGQRQMLYADDGAHCGRATYAPDGVVLAFARAATGQDGTQQIHRLNRFTNQSAPFPGAPSSSYDPVFSPDGAWLIFAARDGEQTDIWALPGNPTDGSSPTPLRLTSLGTARAPAFSPDGRKIAFLAIPEGKEGFDLWVADLSVDNRGMLRVDEPRQVTQGMRLDADSGISWAP